MNEIIGNEKDVAERRIYKTTKDWTVNNLVQLFGCLLGHQATQPKVFQSLI